MSGRSVPCAARLSQKDLAFLRRAAAGRPGHHAPDMIPGETVVWTGEHRTVARLSPLFVQFFVSKGIARLTDEGRRVLAERAP